MPSSAGEAEPVPAERRQPVAVQEADQPAHRERRRDRGHRDAEQRPSPTRAARPGRRGAAASRRRPRRAWAGRAGRRTRRPSRGRRPTRSPPTIIVIEREVPGQSARHCSAPIASAWRQSSWSIARSPRLRARAAVERDHERAAARERAQHRQRWNRSASIHFSSGDARQRRRQEARSRDSRAAAAPRGSRPSDRAGASARAASTARPPRGSRRPGSRPRTRRAQASRPASSSPSSDSTRIRCPVELTGRYSVMPSTTPRTTACQACSSMCTPGGRAVSEASRPPAPVSRAACGSAAPPA